MDCEGEHESRITFIATGLFLLGSYILLFDIWERSGFLLALSSILLLLVAFRERRVGPQDGLTILLAAAAFAIFWLLLDNTALLPLAILVVLSLAAINARLETLLPACAGALIIDFFPTGQLVKLISNLSGFLSPLSSIRYGIDDLGYMVLYHTKLELPILLDEVKLLLPLYLSLLAAWLVLFALLGTFRRAQLAKAVAAPAICSLFLILNLQKLLYNPSTSDFLPNNKGFLALPLACILLLSLSLPGSRIRGRPSQPLQWRNAAVPLLLLFFIVSTVYLTPFAARSDPLIIIDESHSEWEPAWPDYLQTVAIDPIGGSNNYFGLMNIFSSLYDITLIVDRPEKRPAVSSINTLQAEEITDATLTNISAGRSAVLVIKCVTRPFQSSEVEAILNFTSRGGGLILIGEHTDIYGMCTYLNPISERLGFRYLPTAVQDFYNEARGSITQRGEFPAQMARYMTGDLVWETSCSLEKLDGRDLLFSIYTHPTFFAHFRNETAPFFVTRSFPEETVLNSLFGHHLVMAGLRHGKGKVILFTDSTDFNNGIIGLGDHPQLFMAMVEYAADNDGRGLNKSQLILPIAVLALAVLILSRRRPLAGVALLSLLFLLAFVLSYPLTHYTTPFPELQGDPKIALLTTEGNIQEEYLSGAFSLDKLMDVYFRKNLTAVITAAPTPEWMAISKESATLSDAISLAS
jgi:hypothetical protein